MDDFYEDPQLWPRAAQSWWLRPALLWRRWRKAGEDRDIGVSAAEIAAACEVPWWRWPTR